MKRFVAFTLMLLLLLTACAPAEVENIPSNTNQPPQGEQITQTPEDQTPENEGDPTPQAPVDPAPETPTDPNTQSPNTNKPETPADPETPTQNTPTEKPEDSEQAPGSVFDDENYKDYTTTCMSFNVLACNSGGGTYSHPSVRAPWILDTIKDYKPDLLGCQEVIKQINNVENYDMYTYLTTNLSKMGYDFKGMMDAKGKAGSTVAVADYTVASGLMIFWKKDRFELKDFGTRVYTNDSGRHFQWVKLYDKEERITILMTNTHMSINPGTPGDVAAGDALRARQANELYQFWNVNCKEDMALYATGDYNHRTSTTAFGNMTKGKFVSSREFSRSANADSWIDHVLINGDIQECFKYERCNETYEPAGMPKPDPDKRNIQYCASDHYAVIAYCSNAYR